MPRNTPVLEEAPIVVVGGRSPSERPVPAPIDTGGRWSARRVPAVVAVVVLAGLTVLAATTGVVSPNLEVVPVGTEAAGGRLQDGRVVDAEVAVVLQVDNLGRVAAELRAVEPPDVDGISWRVDGPVPVTLEADARAEVVVVAEVADCAQVDAHGAPGLGTTGRGLLPVTMHRDHRLTTPAMTPGWLDPDAVEDRDPSWVYQVLERTCDPTRI